MDTFRYFPIGVIFLVLSLVLLFFKTYFIMSVSFGCMGIIFLIITFIIDYQEDQRTLKKAREDAEKAREELEKLIKENK